MPLNLVPARADMITDDPARYNLRMTVALVAAYEVLQPRLGREDAVTVIQAAFTEPLGPGVRAGTRAMLDAAPDPFAAMVELCKSRERDAFGASFTFRRPVDDGQRYYLDVHRCYYHDVLAASSAGELTPVMCAFDKAWIEAIDPARHGFRFDRATTIGHGTARSTSRAPPLADPDSRYAGRDRAPARRSGAGRAGMPCALGTAPIHRPQRTARAHRRGAAAPRAGSSFAS